MQSPADADEQQQQPHHHHHPRCQQPVICGTLRAAATTIKTHCSLPPTPPPSPPTFLGAVFLLWQRHAPQRHSSRGCCNLPQPHAPERRQLPQQQFVLRSCCCYNSCCSCSFYCCCSSYSSSRLNSVFVVASQVEAALNVNNANGNSKSRSPAAAAGEM